MENLSAGLGVSTAKLELEAGHCRMKLGKSFEFSKPRFLYLSDWSNKTSRGRPQRLGAWGERLAQAMVCKTTGDIEKRRAQRTVPIRTPEKEKAVKT